MRFEDLEHKKVVIWGAGREGQAVFAELGRRGINATFALTGNADAPAEVAAVTATGSQALAQLVGADVVIKSPGVPRTSAEFLTLHQAGVTITSLLDLWLHEQADRVIAVTGTKGKSTTSSLIQQLLTLRGFSAALVGNSGIPVTHDDPTTGTAVVEVSSYQAAELTVSPRVGVLTSLFPEHLPWHGSFERYVADKLNLFAHQPQVAITTDLLAAQLQARLGSAQPVRTPRHWSISVRGTSIVWAGMGEVAADELTFTGRHNLVNAALALAAVAAWEPRVPPAHWLAALRQCQPLPHRLEVLPSPDGRTWVDDSLATAPEAVVAALQTYPDSSILLIAGGADRGLSFDPLLKYLTQAEQDHPGQIQVATIGPAGERLLAEAAIGGLQLLHAGTFNAAMQLAHTTPAQVVLLSPGAPSFDEFVNYEERSAAFAHAALTAPPQLA